MWNLFSWILAGIEESHTEIFFNCSERVFFFFRFCRYLVEEYVIVPPVIVATNFWSTVIINQVLAHEIVF